MLVRRCTYACPYAVWMQQAEGYASLCYHLYHEFYAHGAGPVVGVQALGQKGWEGMYFKTALWKQSYERMLPYEL